MNDPLSMMLSFAAGLLLGAVFFGGLWWTIRKGLSSPRPALLFLGSAVLRMGIVVAGFYFISNGQWQRLLACMAGFIIARLVVTWLTRGKRKEDHHAPES
ncbi:ATP synthase subunit I [Prosthecobacter sp.]|uniref:ATP synthase subunit I n=1 Tax=Prosthecobacter sp. TaxID=1965333 RepID=UPI0031BB43B1